MGSRAAFTDKKAPCGQAACLQGAAPSPEHEQCLLSEYTPVNTRSGLWQVHEPAMVHNAGCAGLAPTCAAIEAGKEICLANKETLIAGGPFVLPLAAKHNVPLLPADSEHR